MCLLGGQTPDHSPPKRKWMKTNFSQRDSYFQDDIDIDPFFKECNGMK